MLVVEACALTGRVMLQELKIESCTRTGQRVVVVVVVVGIGIGITPEVAVVGRVVVVLLKESVGSETAVVTVEGGWVKEDITITIVVVKVVVERRRGSSAVGERKRRRKREGGRRKRRRRKRWRIFKVVTTGDLKEGGDCWVVSRCLTLLSRMLPQVTILKKVRLLVLLVSCRRRGRITPGVVLVLLFRVLSGMISSNGIDGASGSCFGDALDLSCCLCLSGCSKKGIQLFGC